MKNAIRDIKESKKKWVLLSFSPKDTDSIFHVLECGERGGLQEIYKSCSNLFDHNNILFLLYKVQDMFIYQTWVSKNCKTSYNKIRTKKMLAIKDFIENKELILLDRFLEEKDLKESFYINEYILKRKKSPKISDEVFELINDDQMKIKGSYFFARLHNKMIVPAGSIENEKAIEPFNTECNLIFYNRPKDNIIILITWDLQSKEKTQIKVVSSALGIKTLLHSENQKELEELLYIKSSSNKSKKRNRDSNQEPEDNEDNEEEEEVDEVEIELL